MDFLVIQLCKWKGMDIPQKPQTSNSNLLWNPFVFLELVWDWIWLCGPYHLLPTAVTEFVLTPVTAISTHQLHLPVRPCCIHLSLSPLLCSSCCEQEDTGAFQRCRSMWIWPSGFQLTNNMLLTTLYVCLRRWCVPSREIYCRN